MQAFATDQTLKQHPQYILRHSTFVQIMVSVGRRVLQESIQESQRDSHACSVVSIAHTAAWGAVLLFGLLLSGRLRCGLLHSGQHTNSLPWVPCRRPCSAWTSLRRWSATPCTTPMQASLGPARGLMWRAQLSS